MYYACYSEDAIQLGEEAKAEPSYLVRFWTTGEIEKAYNALKKDNAQQGREAESWEDLDNYQKGIFVEQVEQALNHIPEGDEANAAMDRALAAAVRKAAEEEDE